MKPVEYFFFYQCADGSIIRIRASRKPSKHTVASRGTFIVREWDGKSWVMGCFPEITVGTLNKQKYIGRIQA